MQNKIIILNGTSSSGKTSITAEFKEVAKECYYHVRMDTIHSMLPKRYLVYRDHYDINPECPKLIEENKKGFYFGNTKVCQMGEYARNVSNDMIDIIETLANNERNLIIDYVLFGLEDIKVISQKLQNFDTYMIRVHCEPEELRRREKQRGDRLIGSAEATQILIDSKYNDYVLNSTNKTPVELAQELYDFVNTNSPKALKELLKNE
ncbi:MAG TPA: AAA family ATPase [Rickettsiales bacterium]|nr:AAA family ATPase [Rickettsiales bacterium]